MQDQGDEVGAEEDLWYLRRLDGGLFTMQTVDYILAWVAMEDDGVSKTFLTSNHRLTVCSSQIQMHMKRMLDRRNKSLKDIVKTLQIFHDNVEESSGDADTRQMSQKEILQNLMNFLESC